MLSLSFSPGKNLVWVSKDFPFEGVPGYPEIMTEL
jgi:hypothetical protein